MPITFQLRSGDVVPIPSPRKIPCLLGTCELGVPGTVVAFDPGDDVVGVLGAGKLSAAVLYVHAASGSRVVASPAEPTYAPLPSVTHLDADGNGGTGPAVSIALTGADGPFDDALWTLKVTNAGDLGAGQADIAYDGAAFVESIVLPPARSAVLRGTVNLASAVPAMDALTLIFSAPSATTITFAGSPTTPQGLADAFNLLAIAAPLAVRARIYEDPAGAEYLELYSTATGSSATITVSASSTGEATLGLATTAHTGAAATLTFPRLGFTATFTAGAYKVGETYAAPLVGPRASVSALVDAATAAHDDYDDRPFGVLATVEDFASNTTAAAAQSALEGLAAGWRADTTAPIFVSTIVGTAFHVASPIKATHKANVAAFDADLMATVGALPKNLGSVAVDDCYVAGAAPLVLATSRRSATWAAAAKVAGATKIAANAADGLVPGLSLVAADGLTLARNDAKSTTKLQGLSGPGFWALKSTSAGLASPKFAVCASRAGATSRLRDPGAVSVGFEIMRVIFGEVEFYEGQTWETDPLSPKAASPDETDSRADHLRAVLADVLTPEGQDANVSSYDVTISAPTILDDGAVQIAIPFNPLAVVGNVNVIITATGARLAA